MSSEKVLCVSVACFASSAHLKKKSNYVICVVFFVYSLLHAYIYYAAHLAVPNQQQQMLMKKNNLHP